MPLGNDIIDLSEGRKHRPAYYARLRKLSAFDHEWDAADFLTDIDRLWLLWSIKEAAFKAAVKLGWDTRFSGKHFPVDQLIRRNEDVSSRVTSMEHSLFVVSRIEPLYIHSYVEVPDRHVSMEVLSLGEADYPNQSMAVKQKAILQLSEQLNIDSQRITIAKDSQEIPLFHCDEQPMNVDLTLSHHGNFGAYAFAT